VKDEADAGSSALVVDAHIKQFWAWFTPGFLAITLSDNIVTDLVVNGTGAPLPVSIHVEATYGGATEGAWLEIVEKGVNAYRAEASHQVQSIDGTHTSVAAANAASAPASSEMSPAITTAMPASASDAKSATVSAPAAPAPVAASTPPAAPVAAVTADTAPVTAPAAPALASTPVASPPSPAVAASSADTSMAQEVATEMGCGTVQGSGGSTFVAPCSGYSVLIDCDGGQCRPMHTVNVKKDE
jgi:hypothetical protein